MKGKVYSRYLGQRIQQWMARVREPGERGYLMARVGEPGERGYLKQAVKYVAKLVY